MVLTPLFELLMILALSAQAFGTLTDNYIFDQQRTQAVSLAQDMGSVAHYVQSYCDGNNSDCTGVTFAALVTAKELSAAQSASYGAEMTLAQTADVNGGTDNFLLVSKKTFMSAALNQYYDNTGVKTLNTGSYECFSPGTGGLYKATTNAC